METDVVIYQSDPSKAGLFSGTQEEVKAWLENNPKFLQNGTEPRTVVYLGAHDVYVSTWDYYNMQPDERVILKDLVEKQDTEPSIAVETFLFLVYCPVCRDELRNRMLGDRTIYCEKHGKFFIEDDKIIWEK